MSLLRSLSDGLRSLFRKERVEKEFDEELNGFLEMAAEEKMKEGMNPEDAFRAVRLEQGSLESPRKSSALPAGNFFWTRCGRTCVSAFARCASLPASLLWPS
jgi:hypothetical protein